MQRRLFGFGVAGWVWALVSRPDQAVQPKMPKHRKVGTLLIAGNAKVQKETAIAKGRPE